MNIVVLDGHTLNPGDLSWAALESLGTCEIHPRSTVEETIARGRDADVLITNKAPVSRETIAQLPRLKYIGVTATGYNIVDAVAAKERNIAVTNAPAYGTRSVAQMVFALVLELTQHAGHHSQSVRRGRWTRGSDWCYWDFPLVELDGLTFGIVGHGRIGQAAGDLAKAFGMKVIAASRTSGKPAANGVEFVELNEVFRRSDVISLHCPLTPETKGLVNAERLAMMKTSAFLINTSRGPLVDEQALTLALNEGRIAGAGLDVLSAEPPPAENPLLLARNCIITPHIAWATQAARARLMEMVVASLRAWIQGKPTNVVNG